MKFDYYEKEYIAKSKLLSTGFNTNTDTNNRLESLYPNILYTNSGRVSLRIILDYFKSINLIENKNTEILIPKWICIGVVNSMHKICFPTLKLSNETKGIMVYHQYGFPQNMDAIMEIANDKKLFVIENCVNVIESYYKGRLLGTIGNASIFSLAKMYAAPQAGALYSQNIDLLNFAKEQIRSKNNNVLNNLWFLTRVFRSLEKDGFFWPNLQEMVEALSEKATKINYLSKNILLNDINQNRIELRKINYHYFLNYFKNYQFIQYLEVDVIPYIIPLVDKIEVLNKIKAKLLNHKIWTDIYSFDTNRNLLNPDFKKCLWIPVHQGIPIEKMNEICQIVESVYK